MLGCEGQGLGARDDTKSQEGKSNKHNNVIGLHQHA